MKRILCYGDSNTWGSLPDDTRMPDDMQWPTILSKELGSDYKVAQEGLCARIAGNYETTKSYLNGRDSFEAIYRSATPVNVVIVALGTNDLKVRYQRGADDITNDLLWYETKIKELQSDNEGIMPLILYMLPANFNANKEYFDGDESLRQEVISSFSNLSKNVIIFNDLEMSEDGVHYSVEAHSKVAETIKVKLKELKV